MLFIYGFPIDGIKLHIGGGSHYTSWYFELQVLNAKDSTNIASQIGFSAIADNMHEGPTFHTYRYLFAEFYSYLYEDGKPEDFSAEMDIRFKIWRNSDSITLLDTLFSSDQLSFKRDTIHSQYYIGLADRVCKKELFINFFDKSDCKPN